MILPDLLAEARRSLAARANAKNVFVLPAGAFADFRLDGPGGTRIEADAGEDFEILGRNGRVYARMKRPWYDAFADAWNAVEHRVALTDADPAAYLCAVILEARPEAAPVDECDFILIRQCMELFYLARAKPPDRFTAHLAERASRLRAANARALAMRRNRYAIRACAAALYAFVDYSQHRRHDF